MSDDRPDPIGEECRNTGRYNPPRWTCCACLCELGNIGEGRHTCHNCGHAVECSTEEVPSFVTRLADKDGG